MTIIEVIKKKSRPDVKGLMKNLIGNRSALGLVRFFASHPNGRFSKLAIVHAIDEEDSRPETEKALEQLLIEGLLKTCTENGVCYYLLTRDEPARRVVLTTAELDWRQWQLVLEHV